jgi:uncharacterized protein (TIGR02118 family)
MAPNLLSTSCQRENRASLAWPAPPGATANKLNQEEWMAQLVVLYKTPTDPAAFNEYYFGKHIAIAKKIPGLRKYEVSDGMVATPAGPSDVHLVALLHFDNVAAIQAAFASPEGQAAGADVQTFATGGADMLLFETRQV